MRARATVGLVYGCYDAEGRLIYIGSTVDLAARMHLHATTSRFYDRIAEVRTGRRMPIDEARVLERVLIRNLRPVLNQQHNPDYAGLGHPERARRFVSALAAIPRESVAVPA